MMYQQQIEQFCRDNTIAVLYVFGSRAREVYDWRELDQPLAASTSDINVGALSLPGVQWLLGDKVRLAQALETMFDVPRVDFVVLDEADPFLAMNIIRGERLYAADERAADEYELYVMRRAGDLAPFEKARLAFLCNQAYDIAADCTSDWARHCIKIQQ